MAARDSLEEEFREFVAARSAALLRTAYLLAGDWATAEDLLQTALTKTYLAWKRLGGIEAVEPYARRVLVNTATSWWRRRWHGERPTEVLPERSAPDQIEEQLERDALWRHVQTLPLRQRAVLVLRFYEDLSEAQTADLLGISTGTVKSQTSRALQTLRRRMGVESTAEAASSPRTAGPPGRSPGGSGRGARPPATPDPIVAAPAARPPATPDPIVVAPAGGTAAPDGSLRPAAPGPVPGADRSTGRGVPVAAAVSAPPAGGPSRLPVPDRGDGG
ncbi:SigE family RNA polymerase sigma factor [Micromonospora zhanjiangensis]|uniref:SigE family RNA polymerase sigma factor n=1 Tax=Micromonospora zhanjiangensis TaxID=1522057 RepID=A0ABV8KFK6_9ACTN